MTRTRRITLATTAIALTAAATTLIATRWHYLPKRFAVVDAERVYRGGELKRWPYERVLDQNRIRTIVNLNFPSSDPSWDELESDLASERSVERIGFSMPGDGVAPFDKLEAAADILADPAKQPVFVHCSAGVNRTNAVCAVYRLKHCGWSVERTLEECTSRWLDAEENPELVAHIRAYAARLGATRDAAPTAANQEAPRGFVPPTSPE